MGPQSRAAPERRCHQAGWRCARCGSLWVYIYYLASAPGERSRRRSEIGTAWTYPGLGKFFGTCGRNEVMGSIALQCTPSTFHGTDRVVKKGWVNGSL